MNTFHITVADKIATYRQRDGVIICGNSDYEIEFSFDSEWDSHPVKTARFVHGKDYEDVVFEGTRVAVPIMRGVTSVDVGVFSGNLKTTTPAHIPCRKSILCDDGSPSEPTPDVYAQIIDLLNKGGGGGGGDADIQTIEEMLQGFDSDPGSVKKYVDAAVSAGGSGGVGASFVIGPVKPTSACLWFNTSVDTSGDEAEPEPVKYTVTYNLTNCETPERGTYFEVDAGSEFQDTIYAAEGYTLDTVTVTMGGSAVNVTNGVISIASVTGNIVITATATATEETTKYTVTVNNTHGGTMFAQSRPAEIEEGGTLYLQIVAQSGGNFSINITMGGVDITDTAYTDQSSGSAANSDYGTINIKNVHGNIVITIRPV
jgi:hypothetical protein